MGEGGVLCCSVRGSQGGVGRVAVTDEKRKCLVREQAEGIVCSYEGEVGDGPAPGRGGRDCVLATGGGPRAVSAFRGRGNGEVEPRGPGPAGMASLLSRLSRAWPLGAPGESNVVVVRADADWHTSKGVQEDPGRTGPAFIGCTRSGTPPYAPDLWPHKT